MNKISTTKPYNITIRFFFYLIAQPKAHIYLIVYWINFKHKHSKYITTITKGKRNSWNALEKATSITRKGYQKNELNLQCHQYCTCDFVEKKICNLIARLAYLGLMYHLHGFIFPKICTHLNLLTFAIERFYKHIC